METEVLSLVRNYKDVIEYYMICITKSGMLLDEHDELLRQYWCSPPPAIERRTLPLLIFGTSFSIATIIQYVTGKCSIYYSMAVALFPVALHFIISGIHKISRSKYKQAVHDLTLNLRRQFELNKVIMQYYNKRVNSTANLQLSTKQLVRNFIFPKVNGFLLATANSVLNLTLKLNESLQEIKSVVNVGILNFIYDIPIEQIDISIDNLEEPETLMNYFQNVNMAYVLVSSSFLGALGISLCFKEWSSVNRDFGNIFTHIIPKTNRVTATTYEKINKDFEYIYGTPTDLPPPTFHAPLKECPIKNILRDIVCNLQLTMDAAKVLEVALLKSNHENIKPDVELHCEAIEKLLLSCGNSLKELQYNVKRLSKTDDSKKNGFHDMLQVNSHSEKSIEDALIRHDDPDATISTEEYNLSEHGSEEDAVIAPCTDVDENLLETFRRQKLLMQDLNIELRRRKLITQPENQPENEDQPFLLYLHPTKQQQQSCQNINQSNLNPPLPVPISVNELFQQSSLHSERTQQFALPPLVLPGDRTPNFLVNEEVFGDQLDENDEIPDVHSDTS